ncbi:MAG: SHOCT domain-containing protein [Chloroflexi bacterium]|nr:SHOCT domain-containing protein [Chloroflexota bacterium]
MMGGFGIGGGLMGIFWIVILGLVIWAIVAGTGGISQRTDSARGDTPLEILKKRYARGEIGKEEYEARKQDLA